MGGGSVALGAEVVAVQPDEGVAGGVHAGGGEDAQPSGLPGVAGQLQPGACDPGGAGEFGPGDQYVAAPCVELPGAGDGLPVGDHEGEHPAADDGAAP